MFLFFSGKTPGEPSSSHVNVSVALTMGAHVEIHPFPGPTASSAHTPPHLHLSSLQSFPTQKQVNTIKIVGQGKWQGSRVKVLGAKPGDISRMHMAEKITDSWKLSSDLPMLR